MDFAQTSAKLAFTPPAFGTRLRAKAKTELELKGTTLASARMISGIQVSQTTEIDFPTGGFPPLIAQQTSIIPIRSVADVAHQTILDWNMAAPSGSGVAAASGSEVPALDSEPPVTPEAHVGTTPSTDGQLKKTVAKKPIKIKQWPMAEPEAVRDEQIVNFALLASLDAITVRCAPKGTPMWSPERRGFQVRKGDVKIYEARVDGILKKRGSDEILAIIEVKPCMRDSTLAIRMQETAQMAAWICQHPPLETDLNDARSDPTKRFRFVTSMTLLRITRANAPHIDACSSPKTETKSASSSATSALVMSITFAARTALRRY